MPLTIRCAGQILGRINVRLQNERENGGHRFVGDFVPGDDYAQFAPLCERMMEWERRMSESLHDGDNTDPYWVWDRWMEAIEALGALGLEIVELARPIEEFSLDENGEATVYT